VKTIQSFFAKNDNFTWRYITWSFPDEIKDPGSNEIIELKLRSIMCNLFSWLNVSLKTSVKIFLDKFSNFSEFCNGSKYVSSTMEMLLKAKLRLVMSEVLGYELDLLALKAWKLLWLRSTERGNIIPTESKAAKSSWLILLYAKLMVERRWRFWNVSSGKKEKFSVWHELLSIPKILTRNLSEKVPF